MAITTGIIGLGRIAFGLESDPLRYHPCTHAGTLRTMNGRNPEPIFALEAVCDINEVQIGRFREWWGHPLSPYRDHRELLKSHRPELLIVSSTHTSHYDIVLDAIRSGVPNIMLEKPATENFEETRTLCEEADRASVRIWVNFERRFHPGYGAVRELIRSGRLGAVRHISGSVLTAAIRRAEEGSPILVDGIHWIDLLLWLFGPPSGCSSIAIPSRFPDLMDTLYLDLYYDTFSARLEAGGRRDYFEFVMRIDFEAGRILCGNDGFHLFESQPSGKYSGFRELKSASIEFGFSNPWIEMYTEVAGTIGAWREDPTKKVLVSSPLSDSVESLRIIAGAVRRPYRVLR